MITKITNTLKRNHEYTIICIFVCLIISIYGCTDTKVHCWKTIRGGECVSIKSYEGWNRCVAPCETDPKYRGKTKPYEPRKWTRPRPYVYP